ncbi:MAG: response regulator, partial [Leptolyngbyaceae cyanobacterium]
DRAAAELERQHTHAALELLNQNLEQKVTERTAALQEREARYRGLMEGAGDGILLCDRHGNVLEANRRATELLGYSQTELQQMDFQQLCPLEGCPSMAAQYQQMASQPYLNLEDKKFVTQRQQYIPVDISTSVMTSQGEPIMQVIFRDISDRKQAEQILLQTNAELLRATQLKDEFLANMSHELRTPLNAILGMTEGLQEQVFGPVVPKQQKALQTIERSGTHLLQLINDILDVAKIEAGQMELDLAPTAIAPLCKSSLSFIKQQALKKQIQIETEFPQHLPDVTLDERRIRQVLINLLSNAVKFTPEGGRITLAIGYSLPKAAPESAPEFDPESAQKATNTLPCLEISITDTGIGIAPEDISRLFQPFVHIDSALNRHYAGTGLGLALVKRITELHQGTVTVSSVVNVGSRFTITLPYDATTTLPNPQTEDSLTDGTDAAPTGGNHKYPESTAPYILMVEDNDANISTMHSYLEARGYQVQVAKNGKDAIALIQSQHPGLILMDIPMPGMDGFETIHHIRQHDSSANIPIIALTALATESDRDRCLAAGANDYLSKPVKLRLLASTIQQHLAKAHEQS